MPPITAELCESRAELAVAISHLFEGRGCTSFIVAGRENLDFLTGELRLIGFRDIEVTTPSGYPGEDVFKVFVYHVRGRKPQDIAAMIRRFAVVR